MKADETLDDLGRWRFLRPHQPEAAQRVLACFVIHRPESILDALGPFDGFADAFFEPEAGQSPAQMDAALGRGRPSGGRRFLNPRRRTCAGMRPPPPRPDSAGDSQGPRRSSAASQMRRSSHHQVYQAPGQRVDLACVHADRAHRVHGHRPFDAPVGIGYCAQSALTPVISRPLARHQICSDRTIPTTPIASSGTGGLPPSPRSSNSPLMERHARLSTGCPPGTIAFV